MEASGMEVTVAQNGKEAVDFFAAYGLEATRRIRMLEALRREKGAGLCHDGQCL